MIKKLRLVWNVVFVFLILFILGSCVKDINNIGGKLNGTQEAIGIFLWSIFLIVALIIFHALILVRFEKATLSKEEIEKRNEDFKRKVKK